jgi:voltage-gated sodium channel
VETSLGANEPVPSGWKTVGEAVVWVFAAELALKMFVFADKPREFFRGEAGAWNAFDLAVVVAAFVPSRIEPIAVALRLLRLLRILKLIRAVPQLQVIVTSLLRGTASIFYVALLMALVFYVYGIAGVHLYRENDPFHFSSLGVAFITLFRISMMDDWKVVVHVNAAGCSTDFYGNDDGGDLYADVTGSPGLCQKPEAFGAVAIVYFGTFIIIGALVLVSVFVGIIVTGMQDATEDMNVELDRRKRAKMSAGYFGLDAREVEATNRVFRVLDIDGGGELALEELEDAMRALGVPTHSKFLRQTVDVFADDKTELDASDFLLLVSLCERAIETQRSSGVMGKPFYGDSEDEREEGERLRGALRGLGSAGSRGSSRGSLRLKAPGAADDEGEKMRRDAKDETRAASRAPTGPGPGSRRKIAVSESTRNIAARMDRKEAEARKVFGGMAGMFGRAKPAKK